MKKTNLLLFVCLFITNSAFAQVSFSTKTDFTVGIKPYFVGIGDLNGDGKPDLVTGYRSGGNSITVLLSSTSTGSAIPAFPTRQDFDIGTHPYAAAIGDLNADGKLDLAVANESGYVSVFFNETSPGADTLTLSSRYDFSTYGGSWFVAIGDINGDGKPDLVSASTSSQVSVLLNKTSNGATTPEFYSYSSFATGTYTTHASLGDFNGDGKLDIAAANDASGPNENSNSISVLLNTTTTNDTIATFTAKTNFRVGVNPTNVFIADVNGDGKPDMVANNSGSSTVSVYLNTMSTGATIPTFSDTTNFATDSGPFSLYMGDINGDGKPDIVTPNRNRDNVSVLLNTTSNGDTTPNFSTKIDFSTGDRPSFISIGDLNGDGKPDLAVANENDNSVSVLLNSISPTTQANNILFSNIQNTQAKINWTNGNGTNRAVFIMQGDTGTASPVDSITYTADASFGSGTQIGSTGWYCIYNGTGTNVTVTNLNPGTSYRVMVTEYNGSSGIELYDRDTTSTNPNNFTTEIGPPNLTSPSNGATNQPLNVTLSWSAANGADKYRLEVNIQSNFAGTVIFDKDTVSQTSLQMGGLTDNSIYYWRVSSISSSSGKISDVSDVRSFSTSQQSVNGISPSENSYSNSITPTLSWPTTNGANKYRLEINTDSDFNVNIVLDTTTSTNSKTIDGIELSYNTKYFWRVTASSNGLAKTNTSSTNSFTTKLSPSTLISPSNNEKGVILSPTLSWSSISGADRFRLEVNASSDFTGTVIFTSDSIMATSQELNGLTENTKYYWRVTKLNNFGNTSDTSSTFNFTTGTTTGIEALNNVIPDSYNLYQNYPNPFNPTTIIRFALSEASFVTLKIYNMLGQEVKTLVNEQMSAGTFNVQWKGDDNFSSKVSSGTYIYRVVAGENIFTKKMILLK